MSSKLLKKYFRNYLGALAILIALLAPIYLSVYEDAKGKWLSDNRFICFYTE